MAGLIPEGAAVTIIPDGSLALLPFEALVASGDPAWKEGDFGAYPSQLTYFGDLHPISYYPSITALTYTRSSTAGKENQAKSFVLADPVFTMADARAQEAGAPWGQPAGQSKNSIQLMAAMEDETGGYFKLPRLSETANLATNCKDLYGENCDVLMGIDSTKSNFMNQIAPRLNSYRSLVFATHGFATNDLPGVMEPALALSMVPPGTDGLLTMSEIAALQMGTSIAALTACETGVGEIAPGEGVMSMGRAFLSAGAKTVAMSLWSVSENSSVMLMEEFFQNLKQGKGKLQAWTDARRSIRKAGFEHPFFWAAFVLVGEPN
jgi:hypothetical protein